MGWNSWATDDLGLFVGLDLCSEIEVLSVAKSMKRSGLLDLGYEYINLDDCWSAKERNKTTNRVYAEPSRFPHGMPWLIDQIHQLGFKFGLYSDIGTYTCRGKRPGLYPHYDLDAQTFADWKLDFLKVDYCFRSSLPHSGPTMYSLFRDALNKTNHPMVYSICNWGEKSPWEWGPSTGNLWRISPDRYPWWSAPCEWTSKNPINQMCGTKAVIERMAPISNATGPGGWNNPDFLYTGYPLYTDTDATTEFSFWCIFPAPLLVTTDMRYVELEPNGIMARILKHEPALRIHRDILGHPGKRIYNDVFQVWARPLTNGTAVLVYNPSDAMPLKSTWKVEWLQHYPLQVHHCSGMDIWSGKKYDDFIMMSFSLQPHESLFLDLICQ